MGPIVQSTSLEPPACSNTLCKGLGYHCDRNKQKVDARCGIAETWQLRLRKMARMQRRRAVLQRVLVDASVLHDDQEAFVGASNQLDVLQRIAIDEQQIGECAFFNHAELAGIGIPRPR